MFVLIGRDDYRSSTFLGVFSSRDKAEKHKFTEEDGSYDSYDLFECRVDDTNYTDIYEEEWKVECEKKREENEVVRKKEDERKKKEDEEIQQKLNESIRRLEKNIDDAKKTESIRELVDAIPGLPNSMHTLELLENFRDLRMELSCPNEFSKKKIGHMKRRILFAAKHIGVNVGEIIEIIEKIENRDGNVSLT